MSNKENNLFKDTEIYTVQEVCTVLKVKRGFIEALFIKWELKKIKLWKIIRISWETLNNYINNK